MNAPTGDMMPDTRWLNKAFEWFPPGTSKWGAPRITWRNYMTQNIRKRNIDDDSWNDKNGSVSYKVDMRKNVYLLFLFNDGHVLQLRPEIVTIHRRMRNGLDDYDGQMVSGDICGLVS